MLTAHVAMRVLNVSASGCLIETAIPLQPGTVCELRAETGGEVFTDVIYVARCVAARGAGSRFRIGVRFVWCAPAAPSLRSLLTDLVSEDFEQPAAAEMPGSRQTRRMPA